MRSRSLAAALASLALAACGNYSTDDIAFIEAMPTRETLRVAVPAQPAPPASCPAGLGQATEWTDARNAGVGMNAGLDWILGVVDVVRSTDPTERHRDWRVWGPFPDGKHPGFRIRVVVSRSTGADAIPVYQFAFQVLGPGAPDWTSLIDGQFVGASGRTGQGSVTLHFGVIRNLGLNDKPDDPTVDVTIGYDRRGDPRLVSLAIPAGTAGFGLIDFDYAYRTWASGDSRTDFALADGRGNRIEAQAGFVATGGRAEVIIFPANPPPTSYQYTVCWDASGCVTAVADIFNVSQRCPAAPCVTAGWQTICPPMP